MTDRQVIVPAPGPIVGSIRPPGSKSITNRALVCAALAEGKSTLYGALRSEDTEVMIACLQDLGVAVAPDWPQKVVSIDGCANTIPCQEAHLSVANSGTTIRFLTAMLASGSGHFTLDGVPRMRQRPIGVLVEALRELGVDARCETVGDCPPVIINASGIRGGAVSIRGDVSSQFVSGLMMAAVAASAPVEVAIDGPLVSAPYIDMTVKVMGSFQVAVDAIENRRYRVPAPQRYQGQDYVVEPDASAASYFWAAAAITGGTVTVDGLSQASIQGDVAFCDCLAEMGCRVEFSSESITIHGNALRGVDVDMKDISDTVQTLAAVALFANGPTRIRGVGHIRHKETDRIGDLATELRKLGSKVIEHDDGLRIEPGSLHGADIDTYDDHRMAMSLSLVGLKEPGVTILNPGCAAKTYPDFFADLERLKSPGSKSPAQDSV